MKSKLILQHDTINGFDTFLTNTIEQTTIDGQSPNKSSITLEHIFPLESEEALEIFEKKIKCNTMFRNNVVILHLLYNSYLMIVSLYLLIFIKITNLL